MSKLLLPILFIFSSLLFSSPVVAQESRYRTLLFQADSLINIGQPKSALKKITAIDGLNRREHQGYWQIKAAIYKIKLIEEIEDDAIMPTIKQLKEDIKRASKPQKNVLQSLLAEIYWGYYKNNRWEFGDRKAQENPGDDIRLWNLNAIVTEALNLYLKSLSNPEPLQNTPLSKYEELLEGDTLTRQLRPTLYDLLVHRALDFFLSDEPSITTPVQAFKFNDPAFFKGPEAFSSYSFSTVDSISTFYHGLKILQQATLYHLQQGNREAAADLDLKRLNFLLEQTNLKEKDSLYLQSMSEISRDKRLVALRADALYKLAKYYNDKGDLKIAYSYADTASHQFPLTLGGKNAKEIIKEIESKEFSAEIEQYNLPYQNLLVSVSYRNVKRMSVRVMKLSATQKQQLAKIEKRRYQYPGGETLWMKSLVNFLNGIRQSESATITLPDFKDYKKHRTEFKMSPLELGEHIAFITDADSSDAGLTHLLRFKVTNLSYATREKADGIKEVLVMHRESGMPLTKVVVTASRLDWRRNKIKEIGSWPTDQQGKVSFVADNNLNLKFKRGADSIEVVGISISNPTINRERDPLVAKRNAILFSDRAIYRPGQTVYFKGIVLSTFAQVSTISASTRIKVAMKGRTNGVDVAEAEFTTNNYGTFSGSFKIPEQTLNGLFYLEALGKKLYFNVEEYKRPTFIININSPRETYRFNDSVKVRGSVKALAGYGLAHTKIAYSVVRSNTYGDYRFYLGIKNGRPDARIVTISTDTIVTNSAGDFTIAFKAAINQHEKEPFYTYNLSVSAIAANGETHSTSSSVTIGEKVIRVSALVPEEKVLRDSVTIPLSLSNLNGRLQSGKIRAQLFSMVLPDEKIRRRQWAAPDTMIMSEKEFSSTLPFYDFKTVFRSASSTGKLVKDTLINITEIQPALLKLNISDIKTGEYRLKLLAENLYGDTTSESYSIPLITSNFQRSSKKADWIIPLNKPSGATKKLDYYIDTDKAQYVLAEVYDGARIISSTWLKPDSITGKLSIPQPSSKRFKMEFLAVRQNEIFYWYKEFSIREDEKLKVKLITYRNEVQPGSKELWKLQVTGNEGKSQSAELLATMYDASLDEFRKPESWQYSLLPDIYDPGYNLWSVRNFQSGIQSRPLEEGGYYAKEDRRQYEELKMDVPEPYYVDAVIDWEFRKMWKQANLSINNKATLAFNYRKNSVLVKQGFDVAGRVIHSESAYPWLRISIEGTVFSTSTDQRGYFKIRVPEGKRLIFKCRGFRDQRVLPKKGYPLIVFFGEELIVRDPGQKSIAGDPNVVVRIDHPVGEAAAVAQIMEDNGIYDSANINIAAPPLPFMSGQKDEQKVLPRTNFAETAFFYPHLRTNERGEASFEFTMPESLSSWKFRVFAHTTDLKAGFAQTEIITQKTLMVSAAMPRFFRFGDNLSVQARVVNLSDNKLRGKAKLEFFDALTGAPLPLVKPAEGQKEFSLAAKGMSVLSFGVKVPEAITGVTYKLTAKSDAHSDGEENTIPVLSDRTFISESMPMMVRPGEDRSFVFEKLMNNQNNSRQDVNLTFEYNANATWSAIEALPYLMEYPYECSEQTFNRYFANQIGLSIIEQYPFIRKVFEQWKNADSKTLISNLEKNKELKSILIQETPWLKDAHDETEQKRRIVLLFNLSRMKNEAELNLKALERAQLKDGSFSWFSGSRYADNYISKYILKGIGELKQTSESNNSRLKGITSQLIKYIDNDLLDSYKNRQNAYSPDIYAWYARSYFPEPARPSDYSKARQYFLQISKKDWFKLGVHEQAMLALTAYRSRDTAFCSEIIKSLEEMAIKSKELGWYWLKNKQQYYSKESAIETQALLMKLFSECSHNEQAVEEMKIWLLANKKVSQWETTKGTAAAIHALLSFGKENWMEKPVYEIRIGDSVLIINSSLGSADEGYIKKSWHGNITSALAKVRINNKGRSTGFAALHWQYLEKSQNTDASSGTLKIERKYFIETQTDKGPILREITAARKPDVGDIIKVILQVSCDRDLEYIHLKDSRPSGTEPESTLSNHFYKGGVQYYQVTKDASTSFFINRLSKGVYRLEYELRVVQSGTFDAGIATVESMYAPEINAHSSGFKFEVR